MRRTVDGNDGYLVYGAPAAPMTRRQVFMRALWAGLAAPVLLYGASPRYLTFNAADVTRDAWKQVGSRISASMRANDRSA